jgi:hypothetical protein
LSTSLILIGFLFNRSSSPLHTISALLVPSFRSLHLRSPPTSQPPSPRVQGKHLRSGLDRPLLLPGIPSPPPSPPLYPLPPPSTSSSRTSGTLEKKRKERRSVPYKRGSQRCTPSDPHQRVRMAVAQLFREAEIIVGTTEAASLFEGVARKGLEKVPHDSESCWNCWVGPNYRPCQYNVHNPDHVDHVCSSLFPKCC